MRNLNVFVKCIFFVFALVISCDLVASEKRSYILATASTGGTFYPVGVAVSTLTKVKLEPKNNISMSAITSAGSGDNIKLLRDNEAQFAILQGLYGAWAWKGEGALAKQGPQQHFLSVSMLWQNVEHFVVKSNQVKGDNIGAIVDLKTIDFRSAKKILVQRVLDDISFPH